eukprot:m51a1_g2193 hypothetical protein (407) ;mRNA; r:130357-132884
MANSACVVKLVVIGDRGAGKTHLLFRQDVCEIRLAHEDTCGAAEYDRLRPLGYAQTDVFMLCISADLTPLQRSAACSKWVREVAYWCPFAAKVLALTKADLRGAPEGQGPQTSRVEGLALARRYGFDAYVETSSRTGEGVRPGSDPGVRAAADFIGFTAATEDDNQGAVCPNELLHSHNAVPALRDRAEQQLQRLRAREDTLAQQQAAQQAAGYMGCVVGLGRSSKNVLSSSEGSAEAVLNTTMRPRTNPDDILSFSQDAVVETSALDLPPSVLRAAARWRRAGAGKLSLPPISNAPRPPGTAMAGQLSQRRARNAFPLSSEVDDGQAARAPSAPPAPQQQRQHEAVEEEVVVEMCYVCKEMPCEVLLMPCMHAVMCQMCARAAKCGPEPFCPVCRKKITSTINVY